LNVHDLMSRVVQMNPVKKTDQILKYPSPSQIAEASNPNVIDLPKVQVPRRGK
jgi:hypothetical protein